MRRVGRLTASVVVFQMLMAVPAQVRSGLASPSGVTVQEYLVPQGSHPHDVAPARDGGVWYTAQTWESWATLTQHPARLATSNSGTSRRRMASSSGPMAPHGSPTEA